MAYFYVQRDHEPQSEPQISQDVLRALARLPKDFHVFLDFDVPKFNFGESSWPKTQVDLLALKQDDLFDVHFVEFKRIDAKIISGPYLGPWRVQKKSGAPVTMFEQHRNPLVQLEKSSDVVQMWFKANFPQLFKRRPLPRLVDEVWLARELYLKTAPGHGEIEKPRVGEIIINDPEGLFHSILTFASYRRRTLTLTAQAIEYVVKAFAMSIITTYNGVSLEYQEAKPETSPTAREDAVLAQRLEAIETTLCRLEEHTKQILVTRQETLETIEKRLSDLGENTRQMLMTSQGALETIEKKLCSYNEYATQILARFDDVSPLKLKDTPPTIVSVAADSNGPVVFVRKNRQRPQDFDFAVKRGDSEYIENNKQQPTDSDFALTPTDSPHVETSIQQPVKPDFKWKPTDRPYDEKNKQQPADRDFALKWPDPPPVEKVAPRPTTREVGSGRVAAPPVEKAAPRPTTREVGSGRVAAPPVEKVAPRPTTREVGSGRTAAPRVENDRQPPTKSDPVYRKSLELLIQTMEKVDETGIDVGALKNRMLSAQPDYRIWEKDLKCRNFGDFLRMAGSDAQIEIVAVGRKVRVKKTLPRT